MYNVQYTVYCIYWDSMVMSPTQARSGSSLRVTRPTRLPTTCPWGTPTPSLTSTIPSSSPYRQGERPFLFNKDPDPGSLLLYKKSRSGWNKNSVCTIDRQLYSSNTTVNNWGFNWSAQRNFIFWVPPSVKTILVTYCIVLVVKFNKGITVKLFDTFYWQYFLVQDTKSKPFSKAFWADYHFF